jgi:hypothetical protein
MLADPVRIAIRVASALMEVGVDYLVGGSLASSQYGIPRSTQDVDLIADLQPRHVAPLVEALRDEFYIDADVVQEAVRNRSRFNMIHLETMYKADVFIQPAHEWARQELTRRRSERVGPAEDDAALFFCSAEDIILHKLDWYRHGAGLSDQQWTDVLGVFKVQAEALDAGYLRHWANELGLTDLMEQSLRDAGLAW